MKQRASALLIAVAALGLAGCGETRFMDLLGGDKPSASGNVAVQSNQNLTMPPDLRLPQPGTATSEAQVATYEPPADQAGLGEGALQSEAAPAQVAARTVEPAKPVGDIYERNGISRTRPDGKPKSDGELQAELKQVYLAKKRQTNPGYGTIFNIGAVFKDG